VRGFVLFLMCAVLCLASQRAARSRQLQALGCRGKQKMSWRDVRVAMAIDDGTNEIEYYYPLVRLRELGARVTVLGAGRTHFKGEDGITLRADKTFDAVKPEDFDALYVPGGSGPANLRRRQEVIEFTRVLMERGKVLAGQCHGQQVLMDAGALKGRTSAGAVSMAKELKKAGYQTVAVGAWRDGPIVTGRYPDDLPEFMQLLREAMEDVLRMEPAREISLKGRAVGVARTDCTDYYQFSTVLFRLQEAGAETIILGDRPGKARMSAEGFPNGLSWKWYEAKATFDSADAMGVEALVIPTGVSDSGTLRQLSDKLRSQGKLVLVVKKNEDLPKFLRSLLKQLSLSSS